jgi:hypothetical protein
MRFNPAPKVRFVPQHGMNQQTPASQHLVTTAVGNYLAAPGRKKKRTARAAVTARAAKRSGRKSKRKVKRTSGGKFTKGSAAARRHMAKLRAMRKK